MANILFQGLELVSESSPFLKTKFLSLSLMYSTIQQKGDTVCDTVRVYKIWRYNSLNVFSTLARVPLKVTTLSYCLLWNTCHYDTSGRIKGNLRKSSQSYRAQDVANVAPI